jgi:hypothetical protein
MVEGNAARVASLRFCWRTSPRGTKWLRLTRGEAVNVYFWKTKKSWSYFTDADGRETYRNGFDTELEAMLSAEEDLGDRVVLDERQQPVRKPTTNLRVVKREEPKPEIEEVELEVEVQQEVERQVHHEEPAQTLSARTREDYVKAMNGEDPSTWGQVLWHLGYGTLAIWRTLRVVPHTIRGVTLSEVEKMVREYDQEIVEVLWSENGKDVQINLKE